MAHEPFSFESYPSAGPTAPPPRETRTGDIVVTTIELVVLCLAALLVSALVALLAGLADDDSGDEDAIVALILVPTWGLWLLALVVSVVLMTRKRLSFYVPPIALVLWFVVMAVVFNR